MILIIIIIISLSIIIDIIIILLLIMMIGLSGRVGRGQRQDHAAERHGDLGRTETESTTAET